MSEKLNPPEKIVENINGATNRMEKVDRILGEYLKVHFAKGVSRFLAHMEDGESSVYSLKKDKKWGAKFAIQLVNASAEFETAWHCIRLSNIPACYRHSRVGVECIGFGVLLAIPRKQLQQLSPKLRFIKQLQKHEDKDIFDLFSPRIISRDPVKVIEPKIKGNYIIPVFLDASKKILKVDKIITESLDEAVDTVFHPSSHNSIHNFSYHFEAFSTETGKAGAMFSEDRAATLKKAAENIANLTHNLSAILDSTYSYLNQHSKN